MFDAGIFLILLILAVFFMVISFKFGAVFHILSAIIFFALAVVLISQNDIAFQFQEETALINSTNGQLTYLTNNSTITLIGDGDPSTNDNQNILAWIFMALGVVGVALFFMSMWGMFDPKTERFY